MTDTFIAACKEAAQPFVENAAAKFLLASLGISAGFLFGVDFYQYIWIIVALVVIDTFTGVSKFAARNYGDIINAEPTCSGSGAGEFRFESADQTGTTNDPKLVVTHAAAAAARIYESVWDDE